MPDLLQQLSVLEGLFVLDVFGLSLTYKQMSFPTRF